jgi:translation initiation factor 3 subunit I
MKPTLLQGHERSLTQIKYNRDGDLLFSTSKDKSVSVWFIDNGERLGTFEGHQGSVWGVDPNWETTRLVTGGADFTVRIWDIETGKNVSTIDDKNGGLTTSAKSVKFSYCGNLVVFPSGAEMRTTPALNIFDIRQPVTQGPIMRQEVPKSDYQDSTPVKTLWGYNDETIISGNDNGNLYIWDARGLQLLHKDTSSHDKIINDMQLSKDKTMLITASKDKTAKLFDSVDLNPLKVYKSQVPVNSAMISPRANHVVVGGGQDAKDVTTTDARDGKFEAKFFHLLMEQEFGSIKGHFGPINTLDFHPDGKSYCSGAEDGYIRVHKFDRDYLAYNDDVF